MADREQADVERDVLQLVEEEDHPGQKQQVVVTGHHVFCAEIGKGQQMRARDLLNISFVAFSHAMSVSSDAKEQTQKYY